MDEISMARLVHEIENSITVIEAASATAMRIMDEETDPATCRELMLMCFESCKRLNCLLENLFESMRAEDTDGIIRPLDNLIDSDALA